MLPSGHLCFYSPYPTGSAPVEERPVKINNGLATLSKESRTCATCHGSSTVDNHFEQLDAFVDLYNTKFAIPAKKLVTAMLANGLLDKTKFNEEIEWQYFYLWHHEGCRARHGAAMFAPDYVHWEGMYEMAHRFYIEMVPSIKESIKHAREAGNTKGADAVEKLLTDTLESELHRWYLGKEPPKFWRPSDDDNHGWIFNLATIAHGLEAFLAVLTLFVVHFFNNHFRPAKFPLDTVMFTGTWDLEELKEERPEEYERLKASGELEKHL